MSENGAERRKYSRVFFTPEEGIEAVICSHGDTAHKIPVILLSISSGGLSFMANRYQLPGLHKGDRLDLSSLGMPEPVGEIQRLETLVKYVLDFQHNVQISVGCEFIGLNGDFEEKIEKYVKIRVDQLGTMLD